MDFKTILTEALNVCNEHVADPILLRNAICDVIGNDLISKQEAEEFCRLNEILNLAKTMAENPEPRTIGVLLEKCKGQPNYPAKSCLKWIHTLFEFYYRKIHGHEDRTEQILQSLEADLFEPEPEGLCLPKQKKKRQVNKNVAKSNIAPSPAPQKKVQKKASSPVQNHKAAPLSPNIPDLAYVYLAEGSPTVHVCAECPHIHPALGLTLYRTTYQRAKYKDYVRVNNIKINTWMNYDLSRYHVPPICPKCGDFTPVLSRKNPKITYKHW